MPPVKKPAESPQEIAEMRAQLEEAQAALRELRQAPAQETAPVEDRLAQAIEMLSDRLAQPAQTQRDAPVNAAVSHLLESTRDLEPIPDEGEELLPYDKVFVSKGKNFRIVYKPRRAQTDVDGNHFLTPGMEINFAPNGEFRTRNPKVIEFLMRRGSLNREFWDAENVPGSIPDPQAALERIGQFAIDLDIDGLNTMEAEERAGLNRREVMMQIKAMQRQVTIAREKYAAAQNA
jgi:hypothetical protein